MKACVYTCLIGDYEALNEPDSASGRRIPHFYFTDNPELKSESGRIRFVASAFSMDRVRSQRRIKALAHEYLPEFSCSLYIDHTVRLKSPADTLIERYLAQADSGAPTHSFRDSVYDKFIEVAESGLDEPARIFEQLNHDPLTLPEILAEHPFWTAIRFRCPHNHKSEVQAVMTTWHEPIMRYARRDRLSFDAAVRSSQTNVHRLEIDNFQSEFHAWSIFNQRKSAKRFKDVSMAGAPLAVRLTQLERTLEQAHCTVQTQQHAMGECDPRIVWLNQQFDALRAENQETMNPLKQACGQPWAHAQRQTEILDAAHSSAPL